MPSIAFELQIPEPRQEEFLAWVDDLAVEGIWQEGDFVTIYACPDDAASVQEALEGPLAAYLTGPIMVSEIADRNWNAEWEKTIEPIHAGRFRVRPTWTEAAPDGDWVELLIDPKMSFGTGHHESTRLLLSRMDHMVGKGDRVLDAGTGTGVLAFAALACGAVHADAFDYDPLCIENATENAALNGCTDRFAVELDDGSGLMASPPLFGGIGYEVVIANINREVLRGMLPALNSRLMPGGRIGLAGLLTTDADIMKGDLAALQLEFLESHVEGDWWSAWARKRT